MSERDSLVEALVAEVLGPRGGPEERLPLDEDPLDEYLVGVLAPDGTPSVEVDAGVELVGDEASGADDEEDPGAPVFSLHPGTAVRQPIQLQLDPLTRPASMGLSLAVEAQDRPFIDICCTWARYEKTDEAWIRLPHGEIWSSVDCSSSRKLCPPQDQAVEIRVLSRRDRNTGIWRISVFLVNRSHASERPAVEEHVFQPQIRIRCGAGSRCVPVDRGRKAQDPEEETLDLLYSDRSVLARGHLCSAVWKDVDPERPHPEGRTGSQAPFVWVDGHHLFDEDAARAFVPADVRSEYVPVLPVNSPNKAWREEFRAPELDPLKLAEITESSEIHQALDPLAEGYQRWIFALEKEHGRQGASTTVGRSISGCKRALTRIQEGVELLASDREARLAFCFANRAIALQSEWTKGKVNPWWPFQLAFQLVNLPAVVDGTHPDRETCDLLWFPTGGGKTEAYLGLAAFTLAHRRLRALREQRPDEGAGTAVLSRYTLRLLTIQQYRRALALMTACEFLRVSGTPNQRGWRPESWSGFDDLIWGTHRFSIGLWVGGGVTPNSLHDFEYRNSSGRIERVRGAISILEGKPGAGEPAQILDCPACETHLALPPSGLLAGEDTTLHLVLGDADRPASEIVLSDLSDDSTEVTSLEITPCPTEGFVTVSLTLRAREDLPPQRVDDWFEKHARRQLGRYPYLVSVRASRPGYFIRCVEWGKQRVEKSVDFQIFCPNPHCVLNTEASWDEQTHVGPWPVPEAFDRGDGRSARCPIPAWTVDDQIYARCPSMVVATVDKFARLAYEPRAATIFGNVERENEHLGYYRVSAPPSGPASLPSSPRRDPTWGRNEQVGRFGPPELILQDELHLIEGPLGSMVGLYETAVDMLASTQEGSVSVRPKYIASTATVRQAEEQVQSLFTRQLQVFPPSGVRVDDSFFSWGGPGHPLDPEGPGRLYVGLMAPGRGAQTPLVRAWSRLLQEPLERLHAGATERSLDPFWTLVGYFNAIRELAGAVALVRQDVVQRLESIRSETGSRRLSEHRDPMELSSRADSLQLPGLLGELGESLHGGTDPVNVVVSTSMFGTGVDVDRLGLMFVNGQPKTTSSYIQATGRVGRSTGGLVVTFYRASRPRDLSHYEYFSGYHHTLYRHVEPVTVNPFSPRSRDRALGPLGVVLLRQAAELVGIGEQSVPVDEQWRVQQRLTARNGGSPWFCRAGVMHTARGQADVRALPRIVENRAVQQPEMRRPELGESAAHMDTELDRWQELAAAQGEALLYHEPTVTRPAEKAVVLGDLTHHQAGTGEAFENAPNSLREVESTTSVRGRD
ncbi:DISARM system helicase DrmA [Nocardiopsis deserti]|uniref:DISARM system helicase DrmA n=1 Tax=Nocardiopsis deserti TaxID=2605988 RepID=UPI00123912A2|nr:DISARM system helicase DrmA [Nocardiopsis deserti]